jgi:hypothetical protein
LEPIGCQGFKVSTGEPVIAGRKYDKRRSIATPEKNLEKSSDAPGQIGRRGAALVDQKDQIK